VDAALLQFQQGCWLKTKTGGVVNLRLRMKLGAHMSTSGGVWKALQRGQSIHCEVVVQIFVKS